MQKTELLGQSAGAESEKTSNLVCLLHGIKLKTKDQLMKL